MVEVSHSSIHCTGFTLSSVIVAIANILVSSKSLEMSCALFHFFLLLHKFVKMKSKRNLLSFVSPRETIRNLP